MPRLIDHREYSQILWEEVKPEVMLFPRDSRVYCPNKDWFEDAFIPLLDSVTGIYTPESNDCEDISLEANVLMNRITNKYVRDNNLTRAGNSLSVLCELIIPAGYSLNGVTDSIHAPHTIVFDDLSVWYFEAQKSSRRLTPVAEARVNKVRCRELKP